MAPPVLPERTMAVYLGECIRGVRGTPDILRIIRHRISGDVTKGLKEIWEGGRNNSHPNEGGIYTAFMCVKTHGVVYFQWVPLFVYINYTSTLTCKKSTVISNIFRMEAGFSGQPKISLLAQPPSPPHCFCLGSWCSSLTYTCQVLLSGAPSLHLHLDKCHSFWEN